MLKIKLARFGKRNQPHYRIVVNEARSKRDGKYVALLGHYAPAQEPKVLELDLDAYKEWVEKGAQPTDTVAGLAARYESGNPFPEKKKRPSKKTQAKAAEKKSEEAEDKKKAAEEKKEEVAADKKQEAAEDKKDEAAEEKKAEESKEETKEEK